MSTWALVAKALRTLPTLAESDCDELKYDDGRHQVWVCREVPDDGLRYRGMVIVKSKVGDDWVIAEEP